MDMTSVVVTIEGIAPYHQSRKHDAPFLQGEKPDAYDLRTWRQHQHVVRGTVHIKSEAVHKALVAAAKYSKIQIPGQGKATWTAKFKAGIAIFDDIDTGLDPERTGYVDILAHANGNPTSGARVTRRLPMIMPGWLVTFEVVILDPIITEDVFREMLETAGMFVGIGQNRPENGGKCGRFKVASLDWNDMRRPVAA